MTPENSPSAASMTGQQTLEAFRSWLDRAFGPKGYPLELTGDLSDLFHTLDAVQARLARIIETGEPRGRAAARDEFFHLRIEITSDIPMILDDIKASLDTLIGPFDDLPPTAGAGSEGR